MSAIVGFKPVTSAGQVVDTAAEEFLGSGDIRIGDLVQRYTNIGGVIRAGDNTYTSLSVSQAYGVAASARTGASTGFIKVIPITSGQLWEAACANNTASNQILVRNPLSSASAVTNTSTDSVSTTGIFLIHRIIGAASDKKVIGEFIRVYWGPTL